MTSKSRSMTIPSTFRAFRIHNDATGYRSGIETISLDGLNPGEVVVKTILSPLISLGVSIFSAAVVHARHTTPRALP